MRGTLPGHGQEVMGTVADDHHVAMHAPPEQVPQRFMERAGGASFVLAIRGHEQPAPSGSACLGQRGRHLGECSERALHVAHAARNDKTIPHYWPSVRDRDGVQVAGELQQRPGVARRPHRPCDHGRAARERAIQLHVQSGPGQHLRVGRGDSVPRRPGRSGFERGSAHVRAGVVRRWRPRGGRRGRFGSRGLDEAIGDEQTGRSRVRISPRTNSDRQTTRVHEHDRVDGVSVRPAGASRMRPAIPVAVYTGSRRIPSRCAASRWRRASRRSGHRSRDCRRVVVVDRRGIDRHVDAEQGRGGTGAIRATHAAPSPFVGTYANPRPGVATRGAIGDLEACLGRSRGRDGDDRPLDPGPASWSTSSSAPAT